MPVKSLRKSSARPAPVVVRCASGLPSSYPVFLNDLKARIRAAQVKATLAVNRELITLYWYIGKSIVERHESEGWGRAIVDRLAVDLHGEFPEVAGFSSRNIWYMRAFYAAWTHETQGRSLSANAGGQTALQQTVAELPAGKSAQRVRKSAAHATAQRAHRQVNPIVRQPAGPILQQPVAELTGENMPQPVAEIPWGHNILLLEKLKDPAARLWYARQTIAHGWSRHILALQIDSKLHLRQGRAVTNFHATLPAPQSDLAQQVLKDPYVFDFLTLGPAALERALGNRPRQPHHPFPPRNSAPASPSSAASSISPSMATTTTSTSSSTTSAFTATSSSISRPAPSSPNTPAK